MGINLRQAPTMNQRIAAAQRPQKRTPVMFQRWSNLLFLHWKISPEIIQSTLPEGLYVDIYDEYAWLGIVPFFMERVRPRYCPTVPGLSDFLELNLRTYVYDRQGRPGVWFYSLDANQVLAVKIAQSIFSLPYVHAEMHAQTDPDSGINFVSWRSGEPQQRYQYRMGHTIGPAEPGSLDYFLVERYLLFSHCKRRNRLYVGQVHHKPYTTCMGKVAAYSRDLFELNGFADPARAADHVLMARSVDVSIYGMQKVE
jgi:hypothetical protein